VEDSRGCHTSKARENRFRERSLALRQGGKDLPRLRERLERMKLVALLRKYTSTVRRGPQGEVAEANRLNAFGEEAVEFAKPRGGSEQ
jgi:hypothetical protein